MKKVFSIVMALLLMVTLVACGKSGDRADDALTGKYVAVTGTAMGVTLSGEDMADFKLELQSGGKAKLDIKGTTAEGKWKNDDTSLTLTIENTDMVGKLDKDTITFEGILKELVGTSFDVKLAKEGTDAAKPENFLPEEEKALLGDWVGVSVVDVLDKDASAEISPDSLKATLKADHTATITYKGEVIATPKWSYVTGTVIFEGDVTGGANLYGDYKDGVFTIAYSNEDYHTFTMGHAKGN